MKFYLIAATALLAILGAIAVVTSEPQSSVPLSSSGPDDNSMKTLKID